MSKELSYDEKGVLYSVILKSKIFPMSKNDDALIIKVSEDISNYEMGILDR